MRTYLLLVLTWLAMAVQAAVPPPFVPNEFDTNANATARGVVTTIVTAATSSLPTVTTLNDTSNGVINASARQFMIDFSRYSNSPAPIAALTAPDGKTWAFTGQASNHANLTNGYFESGYQYTNSATGPGSATYIIASFSEFPVRRVALTVSHTNFGGSTYAGWGGAISSNLFGTASAGPSLTYGIHWYSDVSGLVFNTISNGSLALGIGTVPWKYADPVNDAATRTHSIIIDQPNSRIGVDGDGMQGWITNRFIGLYCPSGTNTTHIYFEQGSGQNPTTNVNVLTRFYQLAVMNQAASDVFAMRDRNDSSAKLNRPQTFTADQGINGSLVITGATSVVGIKDRTTSINKLLTYPTITSGVGTLLNYDGLDYLNFSTSQFDADGFWFGPSASYTDLINLGRPNRRYLTNFSKTVDATNLIARSNIAVGTNSAAQAVEVQGNVNVSGNITNNGAFVVNGSGSRINNAAGLTIGTGGGGTFATLTFAGNVQSGIQFNNSADVFELTTSAGNGIRLGAFSFVTNSTAAKVAFQVFSSGTNFLLRLSAGTNQVFAVRTNGAVEIGTNSAPAFVFSGTGTPEGAVTAVIGSLYLRTDGGAGTSHYVKESGSGNTGWVAK